MACGYRRTILDSQFSILENKNLTGGFRLVAENDSQFSIPDKGGFCEVWK
jgi:hypothetical protein